MRLQSAALSLILFALLYYVCIFHIFVVNPAQTTSLTAQSKPHAHMILFVRGSGSTLLAALLNALPDTSTLDEPDFETIDALAAACQRETLCGCKSKPSQLSDAQRQQLMNNTFPMRLVILHRFDAFKHVVGVARKKLSPLG